jgi:tetratricopeptide (TPR) repeat protein
MIVAASVTVEPSLRAQALYALGSLVYYASDLATAEQCLTRAVEIQRTLDDPRGLAASLVRLGMAKQELMAFGAAQALYAEATDRYRALEDEHGLHACLNSWATLTYDMGETVQAGQLFGECLTLARRRDDEEDIGVALANLGWMAVLSGDIVAAKAHCGEALQCFRKLGHRYGMLFALEGAAGLVALQSNAIGSIRLFAAVAVLRQQFHMPHSPSNEEYRDRMMRPARQQLDEAQFVDAWHAGCALSLAAAVDEALSLMD